MTLPVDVRVKLLALAIYAHQDAGAEDTERVVVAAIRELYKSAVEDDNSNYGPAVNISLSRALSIAEERVYRE